MTPKPGLTVRRCARIAVMILGRHLRNLRVGRLIVHDGTVDPSTLGLRYQAAALNWDWLCATWRQDGGSKAIQAIDATIVKLVEQLNANGYLQPGVQFYHDMTPKPGFWATDCQGDLSIGLNVEAAADGTGTAMLVVFLVVRPVQ